MHKIIDNTVVDLGTTCLKRALTKLHEQNHADAMANLRAALRYLRQAGADYGQSQHLIEIIQAAERSRPSTAA